MTDHDMALRIGAQALPLRSVTIDDNFWAPIRETVRTRMLPQQEHQLRTGGQFEALKLQWRPQRVDADPASEHGLDADSSKSDNEPHIFWESDVGKWIEAASYSLAKHPDPTLEASVDEAIELLRGAQQPDGYLNVYFTVVRPGERFTDLRDAHELYCAGHLIEAGVAHYDATGKATLLEIVRRYADLIVRELQPGGLIHGGYDGHQEIELALMKLSNATGDNRYRAAAELMLDARGDRPFYFEEEARRRGNEGYFGGLFPQRVRQAERFREYNQSHQPVREQADAVGHSVRAMYMYSAMTDYASRTNDPALRDALDRLWTSTTERKMYLTGGTGSDPMIEGFGDDFDLSLESAYAETCAAVGLVFWAHRMALATGEGRFADTMELALYNGVLAGASEDGTHYFYGNPMRSRGGDSRHEWFGVACCPPNFARLVESLEYYAYAQTGSSAIINLIVSGSSAFELDAGHVHLSVRSNYPWDGHIEVTIDEAPDDEFELAIRIPSWAENSTSRVGGEALSDAPEDGYLRIRRTWRVGDVVTLDLEIEPRRVYGDPRLTDVVGRVAIARGPLIYCLEGVDNEGDVSLLSLPREATLSSMWDVARNATIITAPGLRDSAGEALGLYRAAPPSSRSTELTAQPYFMWANRGSSTMEIWIREPD